MMKLREISHLFFLRFLFTEGTFLSALKRARSIWRSPDVAFFDSGSLFQRRDMALIYSLSALKLGKQYVALTENACKKIQILDGQELTVIDRDKLKQRK